MRCGGRMPRHQKSKSKSLVAKNPKMEEVKTSVSECRSDILVVKGSKRLLESSLELKEEDSEARTSFALLGAIAPLVAMLDSKDLDSQIAALYALLNLGIGIDR
nr:hypothetical protein [Tanacetum cinerariifolium]